MYTTCPQVIARYRVTLLACANYACMVLNGFLSKTHYSFSKNHTIRIFQNETVHWKEKVIYVIFFQASRIFKPLDMHV